MKQKKPKKRVFFKAIRIRYWWLVLFAFLSAGCVFGYQFQITDFATPESGGAQLQALAAAMVGKTIVIDAGHGGFDPGAIGVSGVKEKDVNLAVAKRLADYLKQAGATVILTREKDEALADTKKADMARRVEITQENQADLFISVQANSIPQAKWRGAQVFYHRDSVEGKALAEAIQQEITDRLQNTTRQAMPIDNVYVVRSLAIPSIVVEVGFLSNPEEAALLSESQYQNQMAYATFMGILAYYGSENQLEQSRQEQEAEKETSSRLQDFLQQRKEAKAARALAGYYELETLWQPVE